MLLSVPSGLGKFMSCLFRPVVALILSVFVATACISPWSQAADPDCDGSIPETASCGTQTHCANNHHFIFYDSSKCSGVEIARVVGQFGCTEGSGSGSTLCGDDSNPPAACTMRHPCEIIRVYFNNEPYWTCGYGGGAQVVNSTAQHTDYIVCRDTTGS